MTGFVTGTEPSLVTGTVGGGPAVVGGGGAWVVGVTLGVRSCKLRLFVNETLVSRFDGLQSGPDPWNTRVNRSCVR